MRTCGRCNTLKRTTRKKAGTKTATRWPSIWELAGGILSSKSSRQRKAPRDGRFGERSDRVGRAILRFWWPIRRRLKECWDGPQSAILTTSCRVRGGGCRKRHNVLRLRLRRPRRGKRGQAPSLQEFSGACKADSEDKPFIAAVNRSTTPKPDVLGTPALHSSKSTATATLSVRCEECAGKLGRPSGT